MRNIETVGDVIDAALAGGANSIQGVHFWSSNLETARRTALESAVRNACLDAAAMARGAGRMIGHALEISSEQMYSPPPMPMMVQSRAASAPMADVATQINPGEQTLVVSVNARYALADASIGANSANVVRCAQ